MSDQQVLFDWDVKRFTPAVKRIAKLREMQKLPGSWLISHSNADSHSLMLRTLTAALICETAEACGECSNCQKLSEQMCGDLLYIKPDEGKIRMAAVDKILNFSEFYSLQSSGNSKLENLRVVVLESCELLTLAASNRLLKIIEEPPPGFVFLLSTQRPKNILATIRSRCLQWQITDVVSELAYSEEMIEMVQQILFADDFINPSQKFAKLGDVGLVDLLRCAEYVLNKNYRNQSSIKENYAKIYARRQKLSEFKKRAVQQGIKLNTQLSAEALGLSQKGVLL